VYQIRQTPLIIYVCGDTARFQSGEARDYWIEDCSAVSENILLAAHAMGLGAVWAIK
jgi:nitroreductase